MRLPPSPTIPIFTKNNQDVIGATNSRQITKLGSVIDVMHFIVGYATKWINVRIVARLYVTHARL
jgi:hypothetical protein